MLHIYGKTKALHHCGNYCTVYTPLAKDSTDINNDDGKYIMDNDDDDDAQHIRAQLAYSLFSGDSPKNWCCSVTVRSRIYTFRYTVYVYKYRYTMCTYISIDVLCVRIYV